MNSSYAALPSVEPANRTLPPLFRRNRCAPLAEQHGHALDATAQPCGPSTLRRSPQRCQRRFRRGLTSRCPSPRRRRSARTPRSFRKRTASSSSGLLSRVLLVDPLTPASSPPPGLERSTASVSRRSCFSWLGRHRTWTTGELSCGSGVNSRRPVTRHDGAWSTRYTCPSLREGAASRPSARALRARFFSTVRAEEGDPGRAAGSSRWNATAAR